MSDDFFNDRIPSCSFRGDPPITWEGEILELAKKQATTYNPDAPGTGEPRFWKDGSPMMQRWITLQTKVRDNDDDDGRRVMVLDSKNKDEAVKAAVKATGTKIQPGGYLVVEFFGTDPNGKNPDNLPKLYRATYTPPSDTPTPTQAPQSQAGTAAPAATATASGGVDPNVAVLINKGIDPAKVAGMTPETRALLAATL